MAEGMQGEAAIKINIHESNYSCSRSRNKTQTYILVPVKALTFDLWLLTFDLLLPQIYIRIIPNIQRPRLPTDGGITSDEGKIKNNINEVGIGTDNGAFDDGKIDLCIVTYCYVRTYDGIFYSTSFTNTYRLNQNGIFILGALFRSCIEFF